MDDRSVATSMSTTESDRAKRQKIVLQGVVVTITAIAIQFREKIC